MMDQELRRRQMDIQRDLHGPSEQSSVSFTLSSKSSSASIEASDKRKGKRAAEKPSQLSRRESVSSSGSASTSRTVSPTRTGSKPRKSRNTKKSAGKGQSSSSSSLASSLGKHAQRDLSRLDSSSDSRRRPPLPSSLEVSVDSGRQLSKVDNSAEAGQLRAIREWVRMREAGSDRHIQTVVDNNQRLLKLNDIIRSQKIRGLKDYHEEREPYSVGGNGSTKQSGSLLQAIVDLLANGLEGSGKEVEEDENTYIENDEGREKERAQWREDRARLEASLESERMANRKKDSRIQNMSQRLEELLELEQEWKNHLDQEKGKHKDVQFAMAEALTDKEKELDEAVQQGVENQSKTRKLTLEVSALNRQIQDLEDQLRRQVNKAQASFSEHGNQTKEYQNQIKHLDNQTKELERRLALEQDLQAREEEEAHTLFKTQIQELVHTLHEKDDELQDKNDEIQELGGRIQEYQRELDRRQGEADEIQTLLQEMQERQKNDLRETTLKLEEKNHQLQNEILQLKQELSKRTAQLSQSNSSSNTAASTIQHLQTRVEEQENQIRGLEQELDLARKQVENVVADFEQEIQALESDCSKLQSNLQEATRREEVAQTRAGDLEVHLGHRDQELIRELDQRQVKERQLLEKLLTDMEMEDHDEGQVDQLTNDNDSTMDGSIRYIYSRLQERIRELRQGCLYHDELRHQVDQLQNDLVASEKIQQQLRHQLQSRGSQPAENGSVSKRTRDGHSNLSSSRQQHTRAVDQDAEYLQMAKAQLQELEDRVSTLQDEKQELLERLDTAQEEIQEMQGDMLDRRDALKDLKARYSEKIESLKNEVVKQRKMVVKQEGQLFLYLSVIEKLKMQIRGDDVQGGSLRDNPVDQVNPVE